jgi:Domain of unknown function (DUF4389)
MYPVAYEADYVREWDRLTTFFRLILAIPWFIVATVYLIAVFFAVIAAWFALLLTGRYPEGLYSFDSGALRFFIRVSGWFSLQTDPWPPFGFGTHPTYQIRVQISPRAESQSAYMLLLRDEYPPVGDEGGQIGDVRPATVEPTAPTPQPAG